MGFKHLFRWGIFHQESSSMFIQAAHQLALALSVLPTLPGLLMTHPTYTPYQDLPKGVFNIASV